MAVATVTQWKVIPQQAAKFIENVETARKIHERLGGAVRVWSNAIGGEPGNAIGGEPGTVNYVIQFDDMSGFAAFSDAMNADAEWQESWATASSQSEPSATMLGNALMQEM